MIPTPVLDLVAFSWRLRVLSPPGERVGMRGEIAAPERWIVRLEEQATVMLAAASSANL
jgi:hypothetical protein